MRDNHRTPQRQNRHSTTRVGRAIWGIGALVLIAAMAFAPAAFAAGDPVASGSVQLQLSAAFKKQLKRNGVKVSNTFNVEDGSIDPVTGTGSLTLDKLSFRHGRRKLTYNHVTATVGPGGGLTANGLQLFRLNGGRVGRSGFGATITGARASLPAGAARKLNRKLGVHALHPGGAGTAVVSAQPRTVQVTGGTTSLSIYSATVSGSVAAKLSAHCVDVANEITPLAPATSDGLLPPVYTFPVTGGTISPAGTVGVVNLTGGLRLVNHQTGGRCPTTTHGQLDETDFTFDLERQTTVAHVWVGGRQLPPMGDQGVLTSSNLDLSSLSVNPNPDVHSITSTGAAITINGGTALYLNVVFPQPRSTYDAAKEFVAGDKLGTSQLSLTVR